YDCPVAMLHVPYQSEGRILPHHIEYIVQQLRTEVIPKLEAISGRRYDEDRLREMLRLSAQAEDDLVWVLESAKHVPSPIDAYFGGVYYIGPMFTAFRGTAEGVAYSRVLREEVEARLRAGLGPLTPEGSKGKGRYRLVMEGPPNWPSFREFLKIFYVLSAGVMPRIYTIARRRSHRSFLPGPKRPFGTQGASD